MTAEPPATSDGTDSKGRAANGRAGGAAEDAQVSLRRLLAFAAPERALLLGGLVFLLLGSGASLVWPQAIRTLIDGALEAAAGAAGAAEVDRTSLFLLGLFFAQSVAVALRHYLFSIAGERIVLRLRRALYSALVRREIAFFDTHTTGELVSRLAADSTAVQGVLSSSLSIALRDVVLIGGGIGLLLWTSPELTAWMLAVVPAVALGAVFFGRRIHAVSKEAHDALAEAGHVSQETLSGIRTVRAFVREEHEERRYSGAVQSTYELFRRRTRHASLFYALSSFGAFGSIALVFWNGGRLVIAGELTVGGLTAFLLYTMTVAMAIAGLGELWADLSRARGASQRVFAMIDEHPAARGERPPRYLTPAERLGRVVFEDVSFRYPARPERLVLEHVSFAIEPGEVVALVGPSGGGKSTIAGLLLGFYEPTAGRILVGGRDLRELDLASVRAHIGTVAQEPLLFSASIRENVRYGRAEATDTEVEAAARAAHAHDFTIALPEGYATEVGERGVRLSTGQKQRVAIARALIRDPEFLLLDEATSALDAESEHLVQAALEHLMAGRTTLVIAHRMATVRRADRVLVVDAGRIVESGPHAHLMQRPDGLYRRFVERQLAS